MFHVKSLFIQTADIHNRELGFHDKSPQALSIGSLGSTTNHYLYRHQAFTIGSLGSTSSHYSYRAEALTIENLGSTPESLFIQITGTHNREPGFHANHCSYRPQALTIRSLGSTPSQCSHRPHPLSIVTQTTDTQHKQL